jgi:dihydrofolate synthase/folylpolyglutamate synthase
LERFTERIKLNEKEITEEEFRELFHNKIETWLNQYDSKIYGSPTEFEVINAIAFEYFHQQKAEIAIIEAGLGGRIDSTNALNKVLVSVITSISLDHTERLGKTLQEISEEKAGIIKTGVPLVTTVKNTCRKAFNSKTTEVYYADPDTLEEKESKIVFTLNSSDKVFFPKLYREFNCLDAESIFYNKKLTIPLWCNYQNENLAIAIKVMDILFKQNKLPLKSIKNGEIIPLVQKALKNTFWPGRFEFVSYYNYQLILDGAHNEKGMQNFCQTLAKFKKDFRIITIFACNKDKDYKNMLDELSAISDFIIVTQSHVVVKAQNPEELSDYLNYQQKDHKIIKDYNQTIDFACKIVSEKSFSPKKTFICICGSLYLVGAVRTFLNNLSPGRSLSHSQIIN